MKTISTLQRVVFRFSFRLVTRQHISFWVCVKHFLLLAATKIPEAHNFATDDIITATVIMLEVHPWKRNWNWKCIAVEHAQIPTAYHVHLNVHDNKNIWICPGQWTKSFGQFLVGIIKKLTLTHDANCIKSSLPSTDIADGGGGPYLRFP